MLCKFHWIVLYTVHFTAFCLRGPFFSGHGVHIITWHTFAVLSFALCLAAYLFAVCCTLPQFGRFSQWWAY